MFKDFSSNQTNFCKLFIFLFQFSFFYNIAYPKDMLFAKEDSQIEQILDEKYNQINENFYILGIGDARNKDH